MNRLRHLRRLVLLLASLFVALRVSGVAATMPAVLSPDEIMAKAVARAESSTAREARPDYFYTKKTITEDLDSKGHVKERKERLYEVSVAAGLSYLKLTQLNGQNLSTAELKKQAEREAAERQKLADAKPGQKGDDRENFLTAELVQKFNFSLSSQQVINGRNAYVLTFEPKSGLGVKRLTDRFVNQMAGTAWIDAEDFEIARAEIHLKAEVSLWGGMAGTLRHCRFTLERTRLADGSWFNSYSHGIFEGRKLLEPMLGTATAVRVRVISGRPAWRRNSHGEEAKSLISTPNRRQPQQSPLCLAGYCRTAARRNDTRSFAPAEPKPSKYGRVVLRREKAHRGGQDRHRHPRFPAPNIGYSYIESLAGKLKASCGCGGTAKDRTIEIQGDQPGRIRELLEAEGFRVAGVT